ncbi:HIT family protein [Sulfurimonas sp. C5]|uniref:HIT family protein n=1 Tax=Sulfurimonas sp. C5 TaxID=3036947 RepID=UPI002456C477|nr:HIT family protein [Sulfurimonas sp. C5]MDH4945232.1 HIT family protein [Sulfurimonas sp. C5]
MLQLTKTDLPMHIIFENQYFYIEKEESQIPWLKVFTQEPHKELSELSAEVRSQLWEIVNIIEKEMIAYYKPTKINIASFANMLPRVHIHVMARFEDDNYYPNPMWGEKLRDNELYLPDEEKFFKRVFTTLQKYVQ